MSHRTVLFVALVLGCVLAAPAASQGQNQDKKTAITGQIGALAMTGSGDLRCIGGEPTGAPFPALPCSPETVRIAIRGEEQIWVPAGTEWAPFWFPPGQPLAGQNSDLLNGLITFVVNCNLSANYRGPCWGTFEWSVPAIGQKWAGTWTSPVMDLVTYESTISMVGFGSGGAIEGMQLKVDGFSNPYDWYITFTARIQ